MATEAPTAEKVDLVQAIGLNAGILWRILNAGGSLTIAQIKASTKLPDAQIQQAIGWLAREGKLAIREEKGLIQIGLADTR